MARCIDCLHFDVCKHKLEELCKFTKIEDLIHNCTKFKDRTKHVEVVRCKDCKYQIKEWHSDNLLLSKGYYTYGCYRNFHLYSSNAVNGRDNDFCSYGERREGE